MGSNRPDIELALDVRSHERVIVVTDADLTADYPSSWLIARSHEALGAVVPDSVVIIDRVDARIGRALESIGSRGPRVVALIPANIDQEKSMRRVISAMYPWAEVWTLSTSFGKALVSNGINGSPYSRDSVRDDRPIGKA